MGEIWDLMACAEVRQVVLIHKQRATVAHLLGATSTPSFCLPAAKIGKDRYPPKRGIKQDFHPNIDNDSMVRLKRRTREEREEKEKAQMKAMDDKLKENKTLVKDLSAKLLALQTAAGDDAAKKEEHQSLGRQIRGYERESEEIREHIRKANKLKKWNVGNMCHVVEDRTIVTQDTKENASRAAGPAQELDYEAYVKSYEGLVKMYGKLTTMAESEAFLKRHTDLLNEHATGRLLLWTLELEMDGKSAEMEVVARQQMLLQYIIDLAKSMKRDPREALVPFFRRMGKIGQAEREAEAEAAAAAAAAGGGGGGGDGGSDDEDGAKAARMRQQRADAVKGFEDDLQAFIKKLKARAIEKKAEMAAAAADPDHGAGEPEYEEVEMTKEERLAAAPGGLDPLEVFETLPPAMQEAFSEQDIPKLQAAIAAMDKREAKYHIDRCAASGLWVPSSDGSGASLDGEPGDEPPQPPPTAAPSGSGIAAEGGDLD
eukprot:g5352.t1